VTDYEKIILELREENKKLKLLVYVTVFCTNTRQRCTAHLQRESKDVAHKSKDSSAVILYGEFSEILSDVRIYCT